MKFEAGQVLEFGTFQLDPGERLLTCSGEPIHLPPKAFDSLLVLVQKQGHLIEKKELMEKVWPATFVEESNLAQNISTLRKMLHDGEGGVKYIETVPRRGYRFVAPVRQTRRDPVRTLMSPEEAQPSNIRKYRLGFVAFVVVTILVVVSIVTATAFKVRLFPGKARNASRSVELGKEPQRNYLEGRFFLQKRTESGYRTAIAHFEEAVRLKPDYAQAYAGLADSYILLGSFTVEPLGEVIPRARAAALRAIEIDERSAEAHTSMGYIMSRFDWNWQEADREFQRAIQLDPSYATAHHWYSLHLITMGRTAEAIAEIRQAQNLDPGSLVLSTDTALVLFYARRYDEAVNECRTVLQADASFGLAHRTLGAIYAAKGMYREAIAEADQASKILGADPWSIAEAGRSYALLGNREQALNKLEELKELSTERFVSPSALALLSAALDDKRDETFQWLQKDYDQHSNLAMLTVHPGFDSIRHDPRFRQLLKRIGLPQN